MSTDADLSVDQADLRHAASILRSAATSLADAAPDLRARPDAGASTDELATALAALAEAVSGVGGHLRSLAGVTDGNADDFTATDQSVASAWRQRRGT